MNDCGCPFSYPYTCPACGHARITNHCPHDQVQNPCPACGWTEPGKRTPLQFLGVKEIPGEDWLPAPRPVPQAVSFRAQ